MSTNWPDFSAITDWAFALLTLRVITPGGQGLPADFERIYEQGWGELGTTFGEATASEAAILDLVNIGMHLVDYLVAETGLPASAWLGRVHREYVRLGREGDEW